MQFFISYSEKWSSSLADWANKKYSPNLTNENKIMANLSNLGNNDRGDWRRNTELIEKSIAPVKLVGDIYINVEELKLIKTKLVLSLTIRFSEGVKYHHAFILNDVLNFHDIYSVALINQSAVNNDCDYNNKENNKLHDRMTSKPSFPFDEYSESNVNETSENPNTEFNYHRVLSESAEEIALKAKKANIEWYSFFLTPSDHPDDEEELHEDTVKIIAPVPKRGPFKIQ